MDPPSGEDSDDESPSPLFPTIYPAGDEDSDEGIEGIIDRRIDDIVQNERDQDSILNNPRPAMERDRQGRRTPRTPRGPTPVQTPGAPRQSQSRPLDDASELAQQASPNTLASRPIAPLPQLTHNSPAMANHAASSPQQKSSAASADKQPSIGKSP